MKLFQILPIISLALVLNQVRAAEGGPQPHHSPGQPVGLGQLPDSRLRQQIAAMPAVVQQRAMQRLSSLHFSHADVPLMFASADGSAIGIRCPFTQQAGAQVAAVGPRKPQGAPIPIATPPAFSSKPGATRAIYLDFNGEVVSATQWNTDYSIASWDCRPFDTDGDESTFSDAEQLIIQHVWERVSEDYAPWDVNVTTVSPGSGVTWSHALITKGQDKAGQDLPDIATAAGVAYLDVFGVAFSKPAFVYINGLSGRDDYIAEVCSHETGHNFGLNHDGTTTPINEYYAGHGTGQTTWAPIMGESYNQQVTQFSKGEYTNANNTTQDDLAQITTYVAVRADDHGDSVGAATALTDVAGALTSTGIITSANDKDAVAFTAGAGLANLTVAPFVSATNTRGGNLDVRLDLFTALGVLVTTVNTTGATAATINQVLTAGDYVLVIRGDGEPTTPATGYTTYGSLGNWSLSGTITQADPVATVVASDASGSEVGPDPATFTISLPSAPLAPVTIAYALSGTAVSPGDFIAPSGTVTITAPATTATVTILPVVDTVQETRETVVLTLQPGTGYRLVTSIAATLTIADVFQKVSNQDNCALGSGFGLMMLVGGIFGIGWFTGNRKRGSLR